MNWIQLEPKLWIKTSAQYQKVTTTLKERFGDGMGAGDCEENKPMDLNDERVLKQNQNAIENYKRYIESVQEIRKDSLDQTTLYYKGGEEEEIQQVRDVQSNNDIEEVKQNEGKNK